MTNENGKYWMVHVVDGEGSVRTGTMYPSLNEADQDAQRLAKRHSGSVVNILEVVRSYKATVPVVELVGPEIDKDKAIEFTIGTKKYLIFKSVEYCNEIPPESLLKYSVVGCVHSGTTIMIIKDDSQDNSATYFMPDGLHYLLGLAENKPSNNSGEE